MEEISANLRFDNCFCGGLAFLWHSSNNARIIASEL